MTHWCYAVIALILAGFATALEGSAWAEIGQIKNVAGEVFLFRNNVQSRDQPKPKIVFEPDF